MAEYKYTEYRKGESAGERRLRDNDAKAFAEFQFNKPEPNQPQRGTQEFNEMNKIPTGSWRMTPDSIARLAESKRRAEIERAAKDDPAIKRMQIKAQLDASTFEMQYTQKQKLDIARFKRAQSDIEVNQDFSDQEKASVRRALDLKLMGITPSELPKTNPWPKGQSIGDSYPKYGGVARRNKDGIEEILYRPDQMPDWQKREHEVKMETEKGKVATEKRKHVFELMTKGLYGGGEGLEETRRKVDFHEATRIVDTMYGDREEWWNRAEDQGFEVADEDRDLPEQVGYSKTYIQNMIKQFGSFDNLPPEAQDAYRQAIEVLREHQGTGK